MGEALYSVAPEAGLDGVEGVEELMVAPLEAPQQGFQVTSSLPVNRLLLPAPLVHQMAPQASKRRAEQRKSPPNCREPNSIHEKYRRLMANMEEAQLLPPVDQEGKCGQPCTECSGDVSCSPGNPSVNDQSTQGPLLRGYHDDSIPTAVIPEVMAGVQQQWTAGPLLTCPDTWLSGSPPPLMPDWGAVEPPGVLEAELELLFPDQMDPETCEWQDQLMCTYEPISDNAGHHGNPEMLLEELEDGSESERESSGPDLSLTSLTLLDWAVLTQMFPEHTPLDRPIDTHTQLWNPGNDGYPSNVLHHNAWPWQSADAGVIWPIRSESLLLEVDLGMGRTMCANGEGCYLERYMRHLEGGDEA